MPSRQWSWQERNSSRHAVSSCHSCHLSTPCVVHLPTPLPLTSLTTQYCKTFSHSSCYCRMLTSPTQLATLVKIFAFLSGLENILHFYYAHSILSFFFTFQDCSTTDKLTRLFTETLKSFLLGECCQITL